MSTRTKWNQILSFMCVPVKKKHSAELRWSERERKTPFIWLISLVFLSHRVLYSLLYIYRLKIKECICKINHRGFTEFNYAFLFHSKGLNRWKLGSSVSNKLDKQTKESLCVCTYIYMYVCKSACSVLLLSLIPKCRLYTKNIVYFCSSKRQVSVNRRLKNDK